MDSLKYSIFDIFSYFLPGVIYFIGIYLSIEFTTENKINFDMINEKTRNFSLAFDFFLLFVSYLLGYLGSLIFNPIFKLYSRLFLKKTTTNSEFTKSEKYILVMQNVPQVYPSIELYNTMYIFTYNFGFALIFTSILIKINFTDINVFFPLISLICAVFLFKKSNEYKIWRSNTLDNAINLFDKGKLRLALNE